MDIENITRAICVALSAEQIQKLTVYPPVENMQEVMITDNDNQTFVVQVRYNK